MLVFSKSYADYVEENQIEPQEIDQFDYCLILENGLAGEIIEVFINETEMFIYERGFKCPITLQQFVAFFD